MCRSLLTWKAFASSVLVGSTLLGHAQTPRPFQPRSPHLELAEYQKQDWQVEDGLPESNVRMISQQPDGALLLATFSGVFTFDGQSFEKLGGPHNAAAMNVDAVNAVIPGRAGDLWIGTDGAGVIHQTPNGDVNISTAAGRSNERIRNLWLDRAGTLWIATQYGIERYRDGHLDVLSDVGIIGGDITTVFAEDASGGMYFVTSSGLYHWAGGVTHKIAIPSAYSAPVAVYRDRNRQLWVGTMHSVLQVDEASSANDLRFTPRAEVKTQVTILVSDRKGELWIGTKGSGLWRWNEEGVSNWSRKQGLPDDTIRTLFVDDEDNLWIGMLSGGMSRWRKAPFAPLPNKEDFAPSYTSVAFGDSHGDLWFGTWGQGLFRQHHGSIQPVPLPEMPISTPIRTIREDVSGRIWIGTWFNGIYSYDGTAYRHYKLGIESPVNAVSVLLADQRGGLWVGTYTGLIYFPNGIPVAGKGQQMLPGKLVTDLIEDVDHSVLAATTSGLFRIRDGRATEVPGMPDAYILSLSRDSSGTVWAAPRSGGLAWLHNDRANMLPAKSGVPMTPVYNSVEDEHGHIYFGTSRGIFRATASELNDLARGKLQHLSVAIFSKADGMPSSDCSGPSRPSATRGADGTLYFATSKGFVHTTAFAESAPLPSPVARITGWSFGNDARPEAETSLLNGVKVSIDPSETDINFHFNAKRLANPAQIEFRYRLAGYDSGWVTTHSRYARYRRITPGTYQFEVQARSNGEPWATEIATLPVRQNPHFYNTYTFYMLVMVLLCALAAHLYSRRIRRVKGNMGIVLEERNRIARECHDTLMAGFAAISWQLETTSKTLANGQMTDLTVAQNACEMARSMVSHCQAEARRIIWDLRDTDEVTGVLSQALSRAIGAHYKRDDVEIRMAVEGNEIMLPPASVHHLVCIGMEAVSNSLRHGQPRSIVIRLRYDEDALRTSIRDDGKGFSTDRTASRRGHFGLLVMEERARKVGGRFNIISSVHGGTEVTVDIPYSLQAVDRRKLDHQVIRWIGI